MAGFYFWSTCPASLVCLVDGFVGKYYLFTVIIRMNRRFCQKVRTFKPLETPITI